LATPESSPEWVVAWYGLNREKTERTCRYKPGAVLNLFDSENATYVCDWNTGCGEFEMGDALEWQQPRHYELGVRVEF